MENDELVARQARRIAELEDALAEYRKDAAAIRTHIYCCSGPLNGNVLGYSREQMTTFFRIAQHVRDDA